MAATAAATSVEAFARDVCEGLTTDGQKQIPAKYFYDDVGSALFEAITQLAEYGLTRAEERILISNAAALPDLIRPSVIAELGSGNGRKTRRILEPFARCGPVTYYPIDVSASALDRCGQQLAGIDGLAVVAMEYTFLEGMRRVMSLRQPRQPVLVLFLGSSIGNFESAASDGFLRSIREMLLPGDAFLLGADLEQDVERMLDAYDDPAGVTAAFNRNLLSRINRELGADFDLDGFAHLALYNHVEQRVEMHLRALRAQVVSIPAAGLTARFENQETIWTEACHKYSRSGLAAMATRAGFVPRAQWVDEEWPFALSLWLR